MSTAAVADVEATFDNISKLYETHHEFVTELDKTVSYWSPQTSVGSHLKTLVSVVCVLNKSLLYYSVTDNARLCWMLVIFHSLCLG